MLSGNWGVVQHLQARLHVQDAAMHGIQEDVSSVMWSPQRIKGKRAFTQSLPLPRPITFPLLQLPSSL